MKTQLHVNQRVSVRLDVVNLEMHGEAVITHNTNGFYGFAFLHKNTDALFFMQRIIERMKVGAGFDTTRAQKSADGLMHLTGENSTDFSYILEQGAFTKAALTFKLKENFWMLQFSENKLSAYSTPNPQELTSKNLKETHPVPKEVLTDAMFVFMGIADNSLTKPLEKLSNHILRTIK
jgi:hypothetical protein